MAKYLLKIWYDIESWHLQHLQRNKEFGYFHKNKSIILKVWELQKNYYNILRMRWWFINWQYVVATAVRGGGVDDHDNWQQENFRWMALQREMYFCVFFFFNKYFYICMYVCMCVQQQQQTSCDISFIANALLMYCSCLCITIVMVVMVIAVVVVVLLLLVEW